jgi:hypothetical protein
MTMDCMADVLMRFHRSTFSKPNTEFNSDLAPVRFLGFSNQEKGAPRQEISNLPTVCSTFSRSGWSVVISASFAKGGTSKMKSSPHLHKALTRSNKMSPRTLQTVLVCVYQKQPPQTVDNARHNCGVMKHPLSLTCRASLRPQDHN